ncbi:dipeptidase [Kosmotoga arenicorallina S304]|uniref:Dipeptidase n=1 Tax=Kosmotoga arenicorallina S304 TaxID=1453497 RepID=A0A176K114_9BACT|nr:dipeptidase PepV [Kosmotoga arenicorallina]OAA30399.1 dipeptidase [Kosmotoga arenicorallina S304]
MNRKVDNAVLELKDEMVGAISEMIKIPSVQGEPEEGAPFGLEVKRALEKALELGKRLGFEVKNVDNYAGHVQYGNTGRLFGVLGHLDVVPEGTGWSVEPYGGIVKNGYIYGRGAIDDKGPTIAALYALKAIKDAGIEPINRIRIIFGTNEESGWGGINHYLKNEEVPEMSVTPDAAFTLIYAEKGIVNYRFSKEAGESKDGFEIIELEGGEASNMVAADARAVIKGDLNKLEATLRLFKPKNKATIDWERHTDVLEIRVKGISAHGSKPETGVNAISALIDFLSKLELSKAGLEEFVQKVSSKIGYETDGNSLGIAGRDKITGALSVNFGTLKYHKEKIEGVINIRYPVFFNEKRIRAQIEEALSGLETRPEHHHDPLYVSPDSELVKLLIDVYERVTGEKALLHTIGGGTYARAVPNAVAFGPLFPGREETEHQPDERVLIDDLVMMARIYAQLFHRILTKW